MAIETTIGQKEKKTMLCSLPLKPKFWMLTLLTLSFNFYILTIQAMSLAKRILEGDIRATSRLMRDIDD